MEQPPISEPNGDITPQTPQPPKTGVDLVLLAKAKKFAPSLIVASVLSEFGGLQIRILAEQIDRQVTPDIFLIMSAFALLGFSLAVILSRVVVLYYLAKGLGIRPAQLPAGLGVLGCLGLVVLISMNGKATKKLREAGMKVGFLGISKADLLRLEQPASA